MKSGAQGGGPGAGVPRATVSGPGSRAVAEGAAGRVARGLQSGAESLALSSAAGGYDSIPRLRLRLSADASEAEIAQAFERALSNREPRQR